MDSRKAKSSIDQAATLLREMALALPDGALLGSEDEVVRQLAASRPTVRQAARLLEREGLLRVRRGLNGGYFATRPTVETIEHVVCAYLDTLGLDARHTGGVATALWVEALREAASADPASVKAVAEKFGAELARIKPDDPITVVSQLERDSRDAIFELIGGRYIDLIFRINVAFSRQALRSNAFMRSDPEEHRQFVRRWKKAKMMELDAIAEGDDMLAMMAALHTRRVWMDLEPTGGRKRTEG